MAPVFLRYVVLSGEMTVLHVTMRSAAARGSLGPGQGHAEAGRRGRPGLASACTVTSSAGGCPGSSP